MLVHRQVHCCASWQYQRTSAQAVPPSATMTAVGICVPHSQQVALAGTLGCGPVRVAAGLRPWPSP